MRRGISDDKATKQALIAKLAAAKKLKEQGDTGSRPNRPIIGLLDSSDEDEYASSDTENSQNIASDLEDDIIPSVVVAPPLTKPSFNRLRKQNSSSSATSSLPTTFSRSGSNVTTASTTAAASAADSLINDMQGLNVSGTGVGGVGIKSSSNIKKITRQPSAASQSPIPAIVVNTSNLKYNSSNREKAKKDEDGDDGDDEFIENKEDDSTCLILKDPSRPSNQQFRLSPKLSATLYPHQIEGVTWLYGLWKVGAGGILADDMGLGKTMQTSAFLSGLISNRLARRALILAPTTLIATWEKELKACGLGDLTHQYYGTPTERERAMRRVVCPSGRGVILATYGMVLHNAELLAKHAQHDPDDGPLWDLIIMDEGHKLKNPKMQLRGRVEMLPVRQRIILSGTPIQNNLMEMHALFDLVCPGLLGDSKSFKDHYEKRITAGNDKHATVGERERGAATAAALRSAIAPHMLRREKKDVFGDETEGKDCSNLVDASSVDAISTKTHAANATLDGAPIATALSGHGGTTTSSTIDINNDDTTSTAATTTIGAVPGSMPRKNDFVVWLRLKPNQRALYESFLNSDSVRQVLNHTKSALASLTVLKKICDHPALLSERAAEGIISGAERAAQGLDKESNSFRKKKKKDATGNFINDDEDLHDISASSSDSEEDDEDSETDGEEEEEELEEGEYISPNKKNISATSTAGATTSTYDAVVADYDTWVGSGLEHKIIDDLHKTGFEASCKTVFVLSLLRNLVADGHRTLVFSQSRVMLDILEAAVKAEGWRICRIDGTVNAQERANRVNAFQTTPDIPIFLLTSQVGGLGLTLTAADRIIVVDPAWNPSVDSQSVDRAYRIGQKRDVVVYRLISCGTVEDKIYRKQVFKGGLSRTGMQDGEQFRYFSAAELRDMFRLDPVEAVESSTQKHLHALHAKQRQSTPELEEHLKFLTSLEGFSGISDHDLLYSVKEVEGNGAPEMGSAAAGMPIAAEYQPGFAVPSPLKKGTRGGGGGGGGGAGGGGSGSQEWSGGGDISSMFGKMLSLGGTNSTGRISGTGMTKAGPPSYEASTAAVAAATAARRTHEPQEQQPIPSTSQSGGRISPLTEHKRSSLSALDAREREIESLKAQLEKQEALLSNPVLVAGLADRGAKIKARAEQLRQEIVQLGGVLECSQQPPPSPPPPPAPQQQHDYNAPLISSDVANVSREERSLVAAEKQEGVYLPAVDGGGVVVPPPPPPARPAERPSSTSTFSGAQNLSPFQKIKSSFMGLFGVADATVPLVVPPPPPPPPSVAPLSQEAAGRAAEQQQRHQYGLTTSTSTQDSVRELKRVLYQRAKDLAAAEASGNTTAAASLRREVEELNSQYELAKEKEASRAVVIS